MTGSTGLLGRELVQQLLAMGKDVVASRLKEVSKPFLRTDLRDGGSFSHKNKRWQSRTASSTIKPLHPYLDVLT